jgi:hypothetical protein
MLRFSFTMAPALALAAPAALADPRDEGRDCRDGRGGRDCKPRTKDACFNIVCYYKGKDHHDDDVDADHGDFKSCKAAAKFVKAVTKDGGEVADDSDHRNSPELEVACDGQTLFLHNNSARRFTDLLGIRIQGLSGPHPAITLPRGALHTGPNGTAGSHVAPSTLELNLDSKVLRQRGVCYIWTGEP